MSGARSFAFRFAIERVHPAFAGHFPGRPIVPGALLLDRVLTGVVAELDRPVCVLDHVKFVAVLHPDETAIVACETADDRLAFSVRAQRAHDMVTLASGNLHLGPQRAQQNGPPPGRSIAG